MLCLNIHCIQMDIIKYSFVFNKLLKKCKKNHTTTKCYEYR